MNSSKADGADFDVRYGIIDLKTPRHTFLTGRYKQSFAYHTMKNRLPVTLTSIIDNMTKHKEELVAEYGEAAREEIKLCIGLISKLKYQLQTDKELLPFRGKEPDQELWNDFLAKLTPDGGSFFKACWLHAECYMYRRVSSFFENTEHLKNYDYFAKQKKNGLIISISAVEAILNGLRNIEKNEEALKKLMKLNLWGNRADLSITSGREVKVTGDPYERLLAYDSKIIIDHSSYVIQCLQTADHSKPVIIDFICDNAGYELFTDFVLAHILIEANWATKVRFHVKAIPWFVSDATSNDFNWTLQYLKSHSNLVISEFGKRWQGFVQDGLFELQPTEYFWTSPYEYYKMRDIRPDLYRKLSEAYLVILKGDLNYRKLIGDFCWDYTEKFVTCLRGFQPTNVLSLRTVKADLICGLREGRAEELSKIDNDWMITGEYGTIQFAEGNYCGCDV